MTTDSPVTDAPATPDTSTQRQVRLRVNDQNLETLYANAFRSSNSAEELFLDLGVNTIVRSPASGNEDNGDGDASSGGEIRFDVSHRVIMNYYTAKRMAMLLSNVVRQHEQRFGELKLNAAERGEQPQG